LRRSNHPVSKMSSPSLNASFRIKWEKHLSPDENIPFADLVPRRCHCVVPPLFGLHRRLRSTLTYGFGGFFFVELPGLATQDVFLKDGSLLNYSSISASSCMFEEGGREMAQVFSMKRSLPPSTNMFLLSGLGWTDNLFSSSPSANSPGFT